MSSPSDSSWSPISKSLSPCNFFSTREDIFTYLIARCERCVSVSMSVSMSVWRIYPFFSGNLLKPNESVFVISLHTFSHPIYNFTTIELLCCYVQCQFVLEHTVILFASCRRIRVIVPLTFFGTQPDRKIMEINQWNKCCKREQICRCWV